MSDSLIIVMAHRESTDALIRHWPLWAAHGLPIMVYAPADSIPRIDPQIPMILYGRAEHHGPQAVRRFKCLLDFLGHMDYRRFWIFEYDSFLLDPIRLNRFQREDDEDNRQRRLLPARFYGGVFHIGEDDRAFKGSLYVHPPFGLTDVTLQLINELNLCETEERGFWDRWLGYALEILGDKTHTNIKIDSYVTDGTGFSRNTIEPEDRAAAVAAVEYGAVWIHGCKTEETLTAIKAAYARRVTK